MIYNLTVINRITQTDIVYIASQFYEYFSFNRRKQIYRLITSTYFLIDDLIADNVGLNALEMAITWNELLTFYV